MTASRAAMRTPLATLVLALTLLVACTGDAPPPSSTPPTIQPAATASETPAPTNTATPAPTVRPPTTTPQSTVTPRPAPVPIPDRFIIQLIDFEPASVTIRRGLDTVTARVDGVTCVTLDIDVLEPPAIVLGDPDQPPECRRENAWVTLYTHGGERAEHFRLKLGAAFELGNYGPYVGATPWTGVFEFNGVVVWGFEASLFYAYATCPTSSDPYWLAPPDLRFSESVIEISRSPQPDPFGLTMFRVRFNGETSPRGAYGHDLQYGQEMIPHDLISAEIADDCDWGADRTYNFNRTRWHEAAITSYRFTFQRLCECPREWRGPTEVTVEHGLITSATVEGQPAPQGAALTITDLFDEIQNALNHPVATVITYDEALGYPLNVQLDLEAIAVDGGLSLAITAFEPIQ